MNEQLDAATNAANWFEAFIRHASVMSIVLALLGSWAATAAFKKPLRALIAVNWQGWSIRTFDIFVAFVICLCTWPNSWKWAWAFVVGFGSPVVYFLLAAAICWKWPSLKPYLTLRELASDDTPASSDAPRSPPGDTQ